MMSKYVFIPIPKEDTLSLAASASSNALCLKYFGNYKDIPDCSKLKTKNPPISKYRSSSNTKQMRRTLQQFNIMAKTMYKSADKPTRPKPFKKVLVISHGGWIMEFKNIVLSINGKPPFEHNIAKNASLYIYKCCCPNCKGQCTNNCKSLIPKIQPILDNDDSHLQSYRY